MESTAFFLFFKVVFILISLKGKDTHMFRIFDPLVHSLQQPGLGQGNCRSPALHPDNPHRCDPGYITRGGRTHPGLPVRGASFLGASQTLPNSSFPSLFICRTEEEVFLTIVKENMFKINQVKCSCFFGQTH